MFVLTREARTGDDARNERGIEAKELERRVLFSLLGLVIKTSDMLGISLKELTGLVRVVYFRELRMRGMSNAEIATHLDVSERTVKNLSRELRESYTIPEQEHNLPVQIEFMLWRSPMSVARLRQVLKPYTAAQIDEALELLQEEERIELDTQPATPVYRTTMSVNAQLSPEWVKRIGGLNSLIGNLYDTVKQRFFVEDERAFARTLSFYVLPEKLEELKAMFWKQMVPKISGLDQEAHESPDAHAVKLTMFWALFDQPSEPEDDGE